MSRVFFALLFCAFNVHALPEPSAASVQPKSFQTWKDLQVLEAQNQLLRAGARVSQARSGKAGKANVKEQAPLPSSRLKAAAEDPVTSAEKEMVRAKESLEAANALDLTDYVNVYLPSLESQPEVLASLLQKLSKEELSEILKILLTKNSRFDTKRNTPVVGGLSVSPSTAPSSAN